MEVKKILVPTDGSEFSALAMDYAVDIAANNNAAIEGVYVVDRNPGIAAPDIELCDIVNEAAKKEAAAAFMVLESKADKKKIPFSTKILVGDPGEAITKISGEYNLIVMATVGKTGLKKALVGSVSQKVIARAECPVLVVKNAKN